MIFGKSLILGLKSEYNIELNKMILCFYLNKIDNDLSTVLEKLLFNFYCKFNRYLIILIVINIRIDEMIVHCKNAAMALICDFFL